MSVRLRFHGAARTVTGSCYLLETEKARVLIDCGMFQGSKTERELNYRPLPFDPATLTAMLLTHAHIDHTGLIPKLAKHGLRAKIYCTAPTVDLCEVMLADSAGIQEADVRQLNERNRKRGLPEVEPIYTIEDAAAAQKHFSAVAYEKWVEAAPGIRARWWNAGHLLGSASIEVEVARDGSRPLRILFSGDIGPAHKMLQPDPTAPEGFDVVVCESTYGGRDRFERSEEGRREILAREVNAAAARKGALLIPSFAVERTQELVTDLVTLIESNTVPPARIYIDSPLAARATEIFVRHAKSMEHGDDLGRAFASRDVKATESVEDSKALERLRGFRIIIAASGMCDAGRIRHHLKNHLWHESTTVLLAGYQAEGSLGRVLQDGASMVTIMGEQIRVKAAIRQIDDYSGHADGPELVQWIKERLPITSTVFLTHGEENAQLALENDLKGIGIAGDCVIRPRLDDVYEISGEGCALVAAESLPRVDPGAMGRRDANNELQAFLADIQEQLRDVSDREKAVILDRLRKALPKHHRAGDRNRRN
jgi:metallo-beta-lactamase family protein